MLKTIAIGAVLALAFVSPAAAQDVAQAEVPAATTAAASEVPQAVIDACKDDYEKHCSAHAHESPAARDCMAQSFSQLSDPCVTAILDSPLVEQAQQDVAHARAAEESVEAPKTVTAKRKTFAAKPAVRTVKAKRAAPVKYTAVKTKRHAAHRAGKPRRSVAGHIRRGTGIASHYVKRYTRFAFAKVFR